MSHSSIILRCAIMVFGVMTLCSWTLASGLTEPSSGEPQVFPVPFETESGLSGYRDLNGKTVIPPKFIIANEFSGHGLAAVVNSETERWEYIDIRGNLVLVPAVMDNGPDPFVEGLARFIENGKTGFFDETGKIVIPATYDVLYPFTDGVAQFELGGRQGYIDHQGMEVESDPAELPSIPPAVEGGIGCEGVPSKGGTAAPETVQPD